jgi:hypothetical protein
MAVPGDIDLYEKWNSSFSSSSISTFFFGNSIAFTGVSGIFSIYSLHNIDLSVNVFMLMSS